MCLSKAGTGLDMTPHTALCHTCPIAMHPLHQTYTSRARQPSWKPPGSETEEMHVFRQLHRLCQLTMNNTKEPLNHQVTITCRAITPPGLGCMVFAGISHTLQRIFQPSVPIVLTARSARTTPALYPWPRQQYCQHLQS
jgi:hypothetical protein